MSIINLEDSLLRYIFNLLPLKNIKKINSTNKLFSSFQYSKQCMPLEMYKWIYGRYILEKNDIKVLKNNYCFQRYIYDMIYFIENTQYKIKYNSNCIMNKQGRLIHTIYKIPLYLYYKDVKDNLLLKGLLY